MLPMRELWYNSGVTAEKLILVAGGYGYGNAGDEAQCAETLRCLALRYPDFQIRNLTPHPGYSATAHPAFAHDLASRAAVFGQGSRRNLFRADTFWRRLRFRFRAAWVLFNAKLAKRGLPVFLDARASAFVNLVSRASLFFFCGGGYLTGATRTRLWDGAFICRLCRIFGVPVAMSGQTIGEWPDPLDRRIAAKGFRDVALVATRDDDASPRDLAAIGLPSERVLPTHDDELFCEKAGARELAPGPYIAVNFHFWKLPEAERPALLARLRTAFDRAAAALPGRRFQFVPMVGSDKTAFEAFRSAYPDLAIELFDGGDDFRRIRRVFADADLVLTMKHHPIIFAIGEGTPVVSLAQSTYYVHKNAGALEQYGVGACSVDLGAPDWETAFAAALAKSLDGDWFARTTAAGRDRVRAREDEFWRRVDALVPPGGIRKPCAGTDRDGRAVADAVFDVARMQVLDGQRGVSPPAPEAVGAAVYRMEYGIVPALFPKMRFGRSVAELGERPEWCFLWSNGVHLNNELVLADAVRTGAKIVLCEDGFLRSADTWANHAAPPRYRHGCSLVLDTQGCYYDATRESAIERMLNDPELVVTEVERREARRLIDRIVGAKLTKYNHQPLDVPSVGRPGRRKVLVVDQSYGDYAIKKGWADDSTFETMLADAVRDNPDADILVKTHPDTMTGRRKGYYDGLVEHDNVFRAAMPVNPYSLMELVDRVYVCSTQFGFEALMAGKEVHVYGMPFYAGWGLTHDRQRNPRRTRTRTLEEVFHIFYLRYTRWYNPDTGKACSIDEAIDWLLAIRDEWWRASRPGKGAGE